MSIEIAHHARQAAHALQSATPTQKSSALRHMHSELHAHRAAVLAANQVDIQAATARSLSSSLLARLDLAKKDKYDAMCSGVLDIDALPDPTGIVTYASRLDDNLDLYRVTCPIGVLLIIFEARPEVVVQISALAIKSGNAVILKGGKESVNSNSALYQIIKSALIKADLPEHSVQLVETRNDVLELLKLDEDLDLVIPRGSNELVRFVKDNTRIPVLGHADGLCACFVDEDADEKKAVDVVFDAKTNYPAACNAIETLLIHSKVLTTIFPKIASKLLSASVTLKCDARSLEALPANPLILPSTPEDYKTEFLDLTLAVKVVDSITEAISHVNSHGSRHTDVIITESAENAEKWFNSIDSAGVYVNASSRFADGFRYGFGAEVGVSTNKLHARGPVGLEGLVGYKYRIYGSGHQVGMYGEGKREYKHEQIQVHRVDEIERK